MQDVPRQLEQVITLLRNLGENTKPTRELLSIPQAAEYLGQSEHTLREWIRLRKIPFFKINGSIKFRKSRLDKWIDKHEVPMSRQY